MNKIEMYRRQRIADHEQWQADQRREQTQRELDNAETRRKYLARLQSEKDGKAKLADIELDIELEPRKQVLLRQWLADHPGKTSTDFDKSAWQHLRENLIAARAEAEAEKAIAEARSRFGYSL